MTMDNKRLRVKAIKLFGYLSPETEEILKTECYKDIAKHLGKYRDEVFPILLYHDVPAAIWYYWGKYVGDKEVVPAKLLEIGNPKWLCYWGRFVGDKEMVLAKLIEIGNPEWLYNWGVNVGDRDVVLKRLLEIGDPKYLCYWGRYVGDKEVILAKLLEIGDPDWLL